MECKKCIHESVCRYDNTYADCDGQHIDNFAPSQATIAELRTKPCLDCWDERSKQLQSTIAELEKQLAEANKPKPCLNAKEINCAYYGCDGCEDEATIADLTTRLEKAEREMKEWQMKTGWTADDDIIKLKSELATAQAQVKRLEEEVKYRDNVLEEINYILWDGVGGTRLPLDSDNVKDIMGLLENWAIAQKAEKQAALANEGVNQ
jgi:DNA repair exonuclease SbcCD ATPase subunit